MPCSNCFRDGHNIRACPDLEYNLVSDDESSLTEHDASITPLGTESAQSASSLSLITAHEVGVLNVQRCNNLTTDDPTYFDTQLPAEECMVCYEEIERENVALKCGHTYCVQCFIKHMRVGNNCAGCRAPICDPPKKHEKRTLSHSDISDLIENNLSDQPEFITAIRADLLAQTKKYIVNHYKDISETDGERLSNIMNRAIESTDLTFGFWIVGVSMAQGVIAAINDGV